MHPASRRSFLERAATLAAVTLPVMSRSGIARASAALTADERDPRDAARDEDLWRPIRLAYALSPQFINLENGYYTPCASPVLDAWCDDTRRINAMPSFYMRRRRADEREGVRRQLARFAGCSAEELAITRNTTESLNILIHGLELPAGAEIVHGDQEYGSMKEALQQRSRRYGLRVREIVVPRMPRSPAEIVDTYAAAIGPDTRALLVSHMIYLTGQVLPVAAICAMAHARGVEVIVDGAHAFAHLAGRIGDLGCDYYACSLHKWLGAPLGNGLLFVRRDKIAGVWPLFGDTHLAGDDIRKLEHVGTHPPASHLGIAHAIRFHQAIGGQRKEARLRHLKNLWAQPASRITGVTLHTPLGDDTSCAIASFSIDRLDNHVVAERLFDEHGIFTVAAGPGVRVAPGLHSSPDDLARLVEAIGALAAH